MACLACSGDTPPATAVSGREAAGVGLGTPRTGRIPDLSGGTAASRRAEGAAKKDGESRPCLMLTGLGLEVAVEGFCFLFESRDSLLLVLEVGSSDRLGLEGYESSILRMDRSAVGSWGCLDIPGCQCSVSDRGFQAASEEAVSWLMSVVGNLEAGDLDFRSERTLLQADLLELLADSDF